MNPSREEALFQAAQLLDGPARAVFLEGACCGEPALRACIESLLAAHEQPDTALDSAIAARPSTLTVELAETPDESVGQIIGRRKPLERVGEGGCGVVYVAEQTETVRHKVALEVIKQGMDTKAVVACFEPERQALVMMDHPNIAKVLDAGTPGPVDPWSSGRESTQTSSAGNQSRLTSAATIGAGSLGDRWLAHCPIGLHHLAEGHRDHAREHFRLSIDTRAFISGPPYHCAQIALAQLR